MRIDRVPRALSTSVFSIAILLLAAVSSSGQEVREQRGFAPNQVYQLGEIDSVNVFNGDVIVRIPIGLKYPVGPGLEYQFTLTYNSKVWDYDYSNIYYEDKRRTFPEKRSNAGFGWIFSLGKLAIERDHADPARDRKWTYIAPDGAEFELEAAYDPAATEVTTYYAFSGQYLRMRRVSTSYVIDFPNGTTHTFNHDGDLTRIEDRFGNWVKVEMDGLRWTVTDGHDAGAAVRTHYIDFEDTSALYPGEERAAFHRRVIAVDLAAFDGARAQYSFQYADNALIGYDNPGLPCWKGPLLSSVLFPDGTRYNATYGTVNSAYCGTQNSFFNDAEGALATLELPTGGRLEWTYGGYTMNSAFCLSPTLWYELTLAGVTSRIHRDSSGAELGKWTYSRMLTPVTYTHEGKLCGSATEFLMPGPPEEFVVTVQSPGGLVTKHYFSAWPDEAPFQIGVSHSGIRSDHYGLPITAGEGKVIDGRQLSTEVFDCSQGCTGADGQLVLPPWPVRRTYLTYERQTLLHNGAPNTIDVKRKPHVVIGERTELEIDANGAGTKYVDTAYERPDGYGQFLDTITKSNFTGTVQTRKSTIDRQRRIDATTWLLNLYGATSVSENGGAALTLSQACWDTDGFMTRKRVHRGLAGVPDFLTVFTPDSLGNVASESRHAVAAAFDTCAGAPGTAVVTTQNTWQYGTLASSRFAGFTYKTTDLDIDPSTGLSIRSRDSGGRVTTFAYDKLGRLKSASPPAAAQSLYDYYPGERPARVVARQFLAPSTTLSESRYYYDGLGRLIQEKRRMPRNWSTVTRTYDAAGREETVSVPVYESLETYNADSSAAKTTNTYDIFGRIIRVVAPDGSILDKRYTGTGDREVIRESRVATTPGDVAVQTLFSTKEIYDGFGRLVEVVEPLPQGQTSTKYAYDFGDRLLSVTNGQEPRTFAYDRSGLMINDDHPERSAGTYTYDGAGRLLTKQIGTTVNLLHRYDAAGRLTDVIDQISGKPIKEFRFDVDGAVSEPGKLLRQTRYNSFSNATYAVTDRLRYQSTSGRLSLKETEVTTPTGTKKTSQSYTYDTAGQPDAVNFPECLQCGAFPFGARRLALTWRDGLVTAIAGAATNIDHTAAGRAEKITHASGVVDEYLQDATGARLERIVVSNVRDCAVILREPASPASTIGAGATATFTLEAAPGAAIQWYEGVAGDLTRPIAGATQATYTTPALYATTSYWARATASGGGCSQDSLTVTAVVCSPPSVLTPEATTATRAYTNVPLTFSVDVAPGVVTYKWFTRIGATGTPSYLPDSGPTITYTPAAAQTGLHVGVDVQTVCGTTPYTVRRIVAILDVVTKPACTAEFDPVSTTVFKWNHTIMPNENTDMTAKVRMVGTNVDTTYPKRRYSFRWYLDGVRVRSSDLIWTLGAANTNPDPTSSSYIHRFINQSHLRVEAWVSCFESVTASESVPAAVSEPISKETYGIQNGHCPIPGVTVEQTSVLLTGPTATLKASTVYPDAIYQWYEGESGNTAREAFQGQTDTLTVDDVGVYWVRVSSDCGGSSDSPTIVVARGNCQPVRIIRDPAGADVAAGAPATLSVDATGTPSPTYYLWRTAANGPQTDVPVEGSNGKRAITVVPLETTDYYVRVGNSVTYYNDCSLENSRVARVRVTSCSDIRIQSQPQDAILGETDTAVTLSIAASADAPLKYQWFMGESGDMSRPVDPAIDGGPTLRLTWASHLQDPAAGKFWVKLSFPTAPGAPKRCAVDSRTVTVCRLPRVHNPLASAYSNSVPGVRRVLSIGVTGDGLSYQWYEGADESKPLNSQSDAVVVYPNVTTKYWVKVRSSCAAANQWLARTTEVAVCPAFDAAPTADRTLVTPNTTTTLHVEADRADRIEWHMLSSTGTWVLAPTMTGTDPTTPAITFNTKFFARAWSGICQKDSASIDINVCTGPSISFSNPPTMLVQKNSRNTITATRGANDGTIEWQWYEGPQAGNVATSTEYTKSPTFDLYADRNYTLWVRGTSVATGCYDDSTLLTVKVCIPTIVGQPQSIMINPNGSTTLTVTTDNLPGVTYQWYTGTRGDTTGLLAGKTSSTLTVQPAAQTKYWVRVFGCDATKWVDSDEATVSICQLPDVTQNPQHRVLGATGGADLSVQATGTELTYQWYTGNSGDVSARIDGATAATINRSPTYTTRYWVRVTGRCGTDDSASATLARPPVIQTNPAGKPITKGTSTQLTVVALGNELTYQWYQKTATGDVVVNGQTTATLTTPAIDADTTYFCRVSSGSASTAIARTDSAAATLTVCLPPAFSVSGGGAGSYSQSAVTLSVDSPVSGETYQWFRGVSGDTSNAAGSGWYATVYPEATTTYWLRTTRAGCTADSAAKTVTVCRPKITTQPAGKTIPAGTSTTLTVAATGTGPLSYAWYSGPLGDTSNPIGTSATLDTGVLSATTTYWARVMSSSSCSTRWTDSAPATVTVCQPPRITEQDRAKIVAYNYSLTLEVKTTGDDLHYQWYEGPVGDTTKPVGLDRSTYSFSAKATKYYWVRVTGSCGPPISSEAIWVSVYPYINTQPADTTICGLGGMARFTVTAQAVESYQWYRQVTGQAAEAVGTNSSTLDIAVPQVPVQFWVVLTGGQARTTSSKATVSVNPVPTISGFTATAIPNSSQYQLKVTVKSTDAPLVRYKFYEGPLGDTSKLLYDVGYTSINVTPPTRPITYWVRVYYTDTVCSTDRAVTIQ